MNILVK
jgi:Ca2+-binding EF-hand superfamily protein